MFLERFRNVVQTILTQNPQKFSAFARIMVPPPLIRESPPRRGGGTYGYRLIHGSAFYF